ncbi:hypothetical protein Cgig2_025367 [Carnegiea gigantea]|uniref:FAR1 domain-containing protein n=1 Tax=Carnegiea gigantea TaxID=171969 RepID=A0A9Q1GQ95_9CARY|nr:hypothetical protein Cgig2_025367 [Carnegiea gigantea]
MASSLKNPYPLTGDVPYLTEPESPPLEVPVLETSYNMNATLKGGEKCNNLAREELKPKEGLKFSNLDKCEKFYKSYAHHIGFSICKWSSKKGKEGVQKRASTNVNPNQKVKLTKEGCNAMVGFKRTTNGTFVLFRFHEGHTNSLATPRKRHGKTLRELPTYYIVNQWTKIAASKSIFNVDGTLLEGHS